jgi:hypothetical protein
MTEQDRLAKQYAMIKVAIESMLDDGARYVEYDLPYHMPDDLMIIDYDRKVTASWVSCPSRDGDFIVAYEGLPYLLVDREDEEEKGISVSLGTTLQQYMPAGMSKEEAADEMITKYGLANSQIEFFEEGRFYEDHVGAWLNITREGIAALIKKDGQITEIDIESMMK